jgi:HAE1 family hydrophobic/amphiphilic exporter-1
VSLAGFSIRRPVTITMAVLVVLVLGGVSLSRIPLDLLPEMNLPMAVAVATYSGAGPEEVENLVTRPLEAVLATCSNVESVMSVSSSGSSMVMVGFTWGTDMDFAALEMREKIDLVAAALPAGVDRPTVYSLDPSLMPVMALGFSGEGRDLSALQSVLEDKVVGRLERQEGVAYVTLQGGPTKEIRVVVDQERLSGYGLTLSSLIQLLQAENLNLPGGKVEDGGRVYTVRTTGEFANLEEIRDLTLLTAQGVPLRLRDVATIKEVVDTDDAYSLINGQPSIGIMIQKETGANTVQVAARVRKELNRIIQEIPDLKYNLIFDQSEFIELAIGNLSSNAVTGGLLAILVLYVFLRNFRSTLVIALAIPISIIATFTLVYFNGLTLNIMSLGGFALGVGMLVDNSIVVLENIYRHRELGASQLVAAEAGADEVGPAITASTLTTVAVFVPVVFVEGLISVVFRELALTVTFSLLASLLVAITLVPMLASRLLKMDESNGALQAEDRKRRPLARLADRVGQELEKLHQGYRRLLSWSLDHRRLVFLVVAVAFIISMALLPVVGTEFFPQTDAGRLFVSIELPLGATLEETGRIASRVEEIVTQLPEVETVYTSVGAEGYGMNFGSSDGTEQASLSITLKDSSERQRSDQELAEIIRAQVASIAGAEIQVSAVDALMSSMGGSSQGISLEIRGDDLDVLRSLADEVAGVVANVPGTREVTTSFSEARPEVQIKLNRAKASSLGLSAAQVAQTVSAAVSGTTATRYRVGGDEIDVVVQLAEGQRENLDDLKGLLITSPLGVHVPLRDIAELTVVAGPRSIERDNQVRVVSVSAEVLGRPLGSVSADIAKSLEGMNLPEGYTLDFTGQYEEMTDAFSGLGLALALAVLLVYMVMAAQFESFLHPFTIMFSMPLAAIGVILALLFSRTPISVPAFIGFIVLAGVVVNNAIVLVDYINTLRARGLSVREAVLTAGPVRLRPILMTTLTTVLGLIPMALGTGEGSEVQAPLAITLIGGLSMSTILTLVVVPLVYTWFEDVGTGLTRRMRRVVIGSEEVKGV